MTHPPAAAIVESIEAHGGLDRWRALTRIDADVAIGGQLWTNRGQAGVLADAHVQIDPRSQYLVFDGVGPHRRRTVFTPGRIEIRDQHDTLLEVRADPRAGFPTEASAPWDDPQVAYFASYALWNYLTLPFLAVAPGVVTRDVDPWPGADPHWRRVLIEFPAGIDTHNQRQYLNIGPDGLLVRHDYDADVLGGAPAVNGASDFHDHNGIRIAHRRRVTARGAHGHAADTPILVSIDFDQLRVR